MYHFCFGHSFLQPLHHRHYCQFNNYVLMKLSVEFHGPCRMNPNVFFRDLLILTLSPASRQNTHLKTLKSNGQIAIEFSLSACMFSRGWASFLCTLSQTAHNISHNLICVFSAMNCYELGFYPKGMRPDFNDPFVFQLCCILIRLFKQNKTNSLQPR